MIIPLQDIEEIMKKVIKKSQGGSITVAIFVSYDIDSICSC